MTDPHRRVSRVDGFAPIDLRVFTMQDTDLWALIAVVNVHSWKANAGDLLFDFIALKTGWGRTKIGQVVTRAKDLGLITTRNTGHGLAIDKLVTPMSWDEFHARPEDDLDIRKTNISDSENEHQTSENHTSDVRKTDPAIYKNTPERPENTHNAEDRVSPQGEKEKKPGEGLITHKKILESEIGSRFKKAHDSATGMPYRFDDADLASWAQACDLGLTMHQIDVALQGFFDPSSWHRQNHNVRFRMFVGQAQKYAALGAKASLGTKEELCAYYYPWDPRHPFYKAGDRSIQQQKEGWEIKHGPWKPQDDWKPGAKRW